jgi:hypothetical protein
LKTSKAVRHGQGVLFSKFIPKSNPTLLDSFRCSFPPIPTLAVIIPRLKYPPSREFSPAERPLKLARLLCHIGGQDFLIVVAGFKDTDFWILHYAKWRYAK